MRFTPVHQGTGSCIQQHAQSLLWQISGILVTELALLILMLTGLIRTRCDYGFSGIWSVLHTQVTAIYRSVEIRNAYTHDHSEGWIWLALSLAAEAPNLIFLGLNLNSKAIYCI